MYPQQSLQPFRDLITLEKCEELNLSGVFGVFMFLSPDCAHLGLLQGWVTDDPEGFRERETPGWLFKDKVIGIFKGLVELTW